LAFFPSSEPFALRFESSFLRNTGIGWMQQAADFPAFPDSRTSRGIVNT
jgi:hypothetical protein